MPLVGFTWYSLTDQIDWGIAHEQRRSAMVYPVGLFDLNRDIADRRARLQASHRYAPGPAGLSRMPGARRDHAMMSGFLDAHGYDPGPSQRPLLAGAIRGVIATVPAIALLVRVRLACDRSAHPRPAAARDHWRRLGGDGGRGRPLCALLRPRRQ